MQSNPGPRLAVVAGTVTVMVETRDIIDSNAGCKGKRRVFALRKFL
jgi:hypothetical protein